MIYVELSKDTPILDKDGIIGNRLYNEPEGQIVHISFEPGAHLKSHITPVNVAFYVIEGTATLTIGDETADFPTDSLVHSPKDIPHAVTNNGTGTLRILVIKMPKP